MTETDNRVRRNVMRRVRFVHAVRPFISGAAGAAVLLVISLYLLGREVFVAQVVRNMAVATDPAAFLRFIEAAFLNTTFVVQATTLAAGIAVLWLVREAIRLLPLQSGYAYRV
ncbi:MAG TPA: hypothetical protein VGB97_03410 [Candidatus Paceibacterota bacterium]|jgi:hypothetical protein